ncbi:MAG: glycosyltransferase [Undibacterium sp.]
MTSESLGSGISYRGKKYITHTNLHHSNSAVITFTNYQKLLLFLGILLIVVSLSLHGKSALLYFIYFITVVYFIDLLFNLWVASIGFFNSPEIKVGEKQLNELREADLPVYSIFCPLYKEWDVVDQFVAAISKIDWPKEKLDVQLLLEEDDEETIQQIKKMDLPEYFHIVVVPHGFPKTKPKACNYGLHHAKGEYIVIYDAEDIPDPKQLKIAYSVLSQSKNDRIVCAQAKLNFYNSNQNLLTRLFSAEYALWFELMLAGLQRLRAPIPLGGTSNHFRSKDLRLLEGWDPFNVTEDCDLGIRIAKLGFETVVIDSTTLEEANSQVGNWIRQRSRWIKGYMQSYLVHMRRPSDFFRGYKNPQILSFQLVVGGKVASLFINPCMWILTILYFMFRDTVGPIIDPLFPPAVLYLGVISLLAGNFIFFYCYVLGIAKRQQWGVVWAAFFVPFYWLLISIAAWKGLWQLIFRPHYWEKTTHGLHLKHMASLESEIVKA